MDGFMPWRCEQMNGNSTKSPVVSPSQGSTTDSPNCPLRGIVLKRDPSSRQGFQAEVRIMTTYPAFKTAREKLLEGAHKELLRIKVEDKEMRF